MKKIIIVFLMLFSITAFSQDQLTEIKNLQDQISVLASSVSKLEAISKNEQQDVAIWVAIIVAFIAAVFSIITTIMRNMSEMKINKSKLEFEKYKLKYFMKKEAFDVLVQNRNTSAEVAPPEFIEECSYRSELIERLNDEAKEKFYNVKSYISFEKTKQIQD